ncbi:MAG TPA: PLP-dependent aminotransferase family protein [Candidatus Acidoferrales bacterium]|nr:PLP-dependent aminotransferase family protein [Candidatus Acidoferrales bacterium]
MEFDLETALLSIEPALARRARPVLPPAHLPTGDAISFDSGYASPEAFPDLGAAATRALGLRRTVSLQYGPTLGLSEMREWIAGFARRDGAAVTADEVLVVNGAKQGLDLVCRLLLDEGDPIVVTAPTYFTAIPIFRSFGVEFVEIPQDPEGLDVAALASALTRRDRDGLAPPKLIYDVPDFHNPTGITMSRARREALLELAADRGIPVVEDTPYRALRYAGEPLPTLKALAGPNRLVFGLGTFSKLLAPGLRLGWVAAPEDLVARLARLKSDGGTSPLAQEIALEYFREGRLEQHLARVRSFYRSQRDRAARAIAARLPEAGFTMPEGGYYLWLSFPDAIDTVELAVRAHERGVSVIAGEAFYAAEGPGSARARGLPRRYVRVAYSHAEPAEIDEGVNRLAAAYRSMR